MASALAGAGALTLGRRLAAAPPSDGGPYGPFKMGIQSYSLRGYTRDGKPDLDKALAVTQDLGLHFWEAYPAHLPAVTAPAEARRYIERAASHGVTVIGY